MATETETTPHLNFDPIANTAYLRISDENGVITKEISPYTMLDFDQSGKLVGVELLNIQGSLPDPGKPSGNYLSLEQLLDIHSRFSSVLVAERLCTTLQYRGETMDEKRVKIEAAMDWSQEIMEKVLSSETMQQVNRFLIMNPFN